MTEVIRDVDGSPVFIQGYGAVYNLLRSDGLELVKPGAFDLAIQHPSAALNCQFHHMGPDFIAGCLALDTFQVWSDDFGLAFSAGPFNANGRNLSLLRLIASGGIRGASRLARPDSADYEFIDGQRVLAIQSFKTLEHIAPVADPAYAETGVWLSSEHYYDLSPRLRALCDHWSAHRPRHDVRGALRKMARKVSALPRRVPASRVAPSRPRGGAPARAVEMRRAPVPVAAYNPAPNGFSQEEWDEFGFMEDAGRRARKEQEARARARKRAALSLAGKGRASRSC